MTSCAFRRLTRKPATSLICSVAANLDGVSIVETWIPRACVPPPVTT
jgi:hypothetical protein